MSLDALNANNGQCLTCLHDQIFLLALIESCARYPMSSAHLAIGTIGSTIICRLAAHIARGPRTAAFVGVSAPAASSTRHWLYTVARGGTIDTAPLGFFATLLQITIWFAVAVDHIVCEGPTAISLGAFLATIVSAVHGHVGDVSTITVCVLQVIATAHARRCWRRGWCGCLLYGSGGAAPLAQESRRRAMRFQVACRRQMAIENIVCEGGTTRCVAAELAAVIGAVDFRIEKILAVAIRVLPPCFCAGARCGNGDAAATSAHGLGFRGRTRLQLEDLEVTNVEESVLVQILVHLRLP